MGVLEVAEYAYHADLVADHPTLSSSVANKLLTGSPAHAKAAHPKLNHELVRQEEHHFDIGAVAHSILLGGESAVEVVAADDWRTKAAKEARDLARAHGRVPLLDKHWAEVQQMTAAIREQLDRVSTSPPLFTDGRGEQTLVWEDNGVLCRARLDWLRDDLVAIDDYKTARSAAPEKWSRSMIDNGYDVQAAFYLRGVRATLDANPAFRFVAQEKEPPYALTVFALAPDVVALADRKVDWAIERWKRCLENDEWPAYPSRVCFVNLEPWQEMRWADREARDD